MDFKKTKKEFDIKLDSYYTKNDSAKEHKRVENKFKDLKAQVTENQNNISYIQEEIRALKQLANRKIDITEFMKL